VVASLPPHPAIAQHLTPKVLCCSEPSAVSSGYLAAQPTTSTKDATLRAFLAHLIEDEEGGTGGFSYQTFLQEVGKEVCERMNGNPEE
jgi:hypothetical protein